MRNEEYEAMARVEHTLWWYRGLRNNVTALLAAHRRTRNLIVLDAGCGTGGILDMLARQWPDDKRLGIDYSSLACSYSLQRHVATICCGSVQSLP